MRVKIHVGFLGLGNIGSGVWQLIQRRHEQLCERDQVDFLVKRVLVRSLEKPRSVPIEDRVLTTDPQDILQDDSIGLVAEFMGGLEPARSYQQGGGFPGMGGAERSGTRGRWRAIL